MPRYDFWSNHYLKRGKNNQVNLCFLQIIGVNDCGLFLCCVCAVLSGVNYIEAFFVFLRLGDEHGKYGIPNVRPSLLEPSVASLLLLCFLFKCLQPAPHQPTLGTHTYTHSSCQQVLLQPALAAFSPKACRHCTRSLAFCSMCFRCIRE